MVGRAVGAVPEVMRGLWTGQGGTVPKDGMVGEGGKEKGVKEKTKKEKDFERTRRWWFVGTGVTFVVYLCEFVVGETGQKRPPCQLGKLID